MKIYISAFLEEMPGYCDILEKAIEENDHERISYVAHISKPLLSIIGFIDIYKNADQLENDIRSESNVSNISLQAEALLSEMRKVVGTL